MQESLAADAEIGREGQVRMMDSTRVSLISPLLGVPSRAALIVFISGVLPTLCTAGREASIPHRRRGFQTISVVAPRRSRLARNPIRLGNRPAMSRYSSAGRVRLALAPSQGCQLVLFQTFCG